MRTSTTSAWLGFESFIAAYPGNKPSAGSGKNPKNAADPCWDATWSASLPVDQVALLSAVHCSEMGATYTTTVAGNETRAINCVDWYEAFAFLCVGRRAFAERHLPKPCSRPQRPLRAAGGGKRNAHVMLSRCELRRSLASLTPSAEWHRVVALHSRHRDIGSDCIARRESVPSRIGAFANRKPCTNSLMD
jgi:hypothetical protein